MSSKSSKESKLAWWQLSMIGIGCIIGTGFFLGSALAITKTGPSALLVFAIAALGTYLVFDALSKMAAKDPQKGSFRSYAKKAYGKWAGFSSGWVYWGAELLIMGSQLTALSLFTKFWFPDIPLWVFATGYAVLGIAVVLSGTQGFEKMENIFAVVKVAAIFMFLVLATLAVFGVFKGLGHRVDVENTMNHFLPGGYMSLWTALIYAFYAFGGIEIMGIMAPRLKNKGDAPKSGKLMLLLLTSIYLLAIALAVFLVPYDDFSTKESPFVTTLDHYKLPLVPHLFNGAMIIAGFSTMCASLFAVTSMIVTLSKDGDAPKVLSNEGKLKVPHFALGLTILGLITSIILALAMPDRIYEYLTTAAGLMLIYNWLFLLFSFKHIIKLTKFDKVKRFIGIALILLAVSGTLFDHMARPGFFISLLFLAIIGIILLLRNVLGGKKKKKSTKVPRPRFQ
ncbi:amino acid permease [Mesobacillus maritimus]|uniref:amino acid permease n=1 Tax=Mesobacillus maritimus TaxID=1643336 RepID=UPI00203DFDE3|nr:amino acid permease [Mesobacillus maritimus]MCM3588056.1 amino acid permease [Mesobacillus maritimus]MCM3668387.1 amino acid permease [Mesobacillus maritimus]